jgi:predicted AlkP superfamily phosphohydrolase/phosphomutase
MQGSKRLLVIGLDSAEPSLVFDRLEERLPTLTRLRRQGSWGRLQTTVPPSTIPAWVSMFTGLDPGQLGVYGFRIRRDHGYGKLGLFHSRMIEAPRVWDRLSREGLTSYVLGVPGTYPPHPMKGRLVSSFLAPSTKAQYTHPPGLKAQIESIAKGYMLDVEGFRTEDKGWLLKQIHSMTGKRFKVARSWAKEPDWDLMIVVEMGTDRMHHGFWRYFDGTHRLYEPNNPFQTAIPDYYAYVDSEIASLIEAAGPQTAVLVVSDHGARALEGGFRINEWLVKQGDMVLKKNTTEIDWPRTRAWGEGGYHGRIFLNIKGREPGGVLEPKEVDAYRADLASRLEKTTDEEGRSLGTRVFFPEKTYRELKGIPPDLMVYFGNLAWRSLGELGTGKIHARGNDTGPDDANHSEHGIFIFSRPGHPTDNLTVLDVTPLILGFFGHDPT